MMAYVDVLHPTLQPRPTLNFHPKKIKDFLTLIKKSMIAEKKLLLRISP